MPLNEFDIIQRYFSDLTDSRSDTLQGIGDDCALLQPRQDQLLAVSTDTLVAGRHFFPNASPQCIGFKSLAVNLSDLAAMGAEPAWVSLALTLPEVDENWLQQFSLGFSELAKQYKLQLIGGDLTQGPLSITVTIHGYVDPKKVLKRQGARVGDLVCVSGKLGNAALALQYLNDSRPVDQVLLDALQKPQPRIALGLELRGVATSCIDLSDGLISDLGHICGASGCMAVIDLLKLPCDDEVSRQIDETNSWLIPLTGGDDYELCFTLNPDNLAILSEFSTKTGVAVTVIGEIKAGSGVVCLDQDKKPLEITSSGYMHFS